MIVDLFAGPGGWDEGLARLGYDGTVYGIEWDRDACNTAAAAGHLRVQADVAAYPPDPFVGADGLIASPPCQAFSLAGHGKGREAIDDLLAAVHACRDGFVRPPDAVCGDDLRADLTLEPLHWIDVLRPRWIACEQVPQALTLWSGYADVLRRWGYEADARVVNAADYGVPQTRRRAVLLARRDGHRIEWPAPTHHDPRRSMSLFGEAWVSMAQALGWGWTTHPAPTVMAGHNGKSSGAEWGGSSVRESMMAAQGTRRWVMKTDHDVSAPAPLFTKVHVAGRTPSPTPEFVANAQVNAPRRTIDMPAPTITSSSNCSNDRRWLVGTDSIRVSVREAGILQSFPAEYPWTGTQTKKYEQVGNAVPPGLAAAMLAPILDLR